MSDSLNFFIFIMYIYAKNSHGIIDSYHLLKKCMCVCSVCRLFTVSVYRLPVHQEVMPSRLEL